MEIIRPPKQEFMAKFERFEPLIKDHTAIINAKTCMRKYFYVIVCGFTPKITPIYFAWGGAYHRFRHILSREYGYGDNEPRIFDEEKAKEAYLTAAQAGIAYWKKEGQDQEVGTQYEFMTQARLIKSFMHAFKHWSIERRQQKIKVLAVEQAFNVQLRDGSSTSGRADEIVRWSNQLWGRDFKTTSKYDDKYYARGLDPNDQFTRYTVAEEKLCGERIQGQIVEVLYNGSEPKRKGTKKEAGPLIRQYLATRSPYQLEQWEKEAAIFNKLIDTCRDADIWPMQEVSCNFCAFHSVCKSGTEAAAMARLQAEFTQRPWDNTKIGVVEE